MSNVNSITIGIGVFILLNFILSFFLSLRREAKRKEESPNTRPYTWGYYCAYLSITNGVLFLLFGVVGLIYFFTAKVEDEVYKSLFIITGFGAIHLVSGFYMLKRQRWAWILNIPFWMNCIIYIINSIYVAKRWSEMGEEMRAESNRPDIIEHDASTTHT